MRATIAVALPDPQIGGRRARQLFSSFSNYNEQCCGWWCCAILVLTSYLRIKPATRERKSARAQDQTRCALGESLSLDRCQGARLVFKCARLPLCVGKINGVCDQRHLLIIVRHCLSLPPPPPLALKFTARPLVNQVAHAHAWLLTLDLVGFCWCRPGWHNFRGGALSSSGPRAPPACLYRSCVLPLRRVKPHTHTRTQLALDHRR